MLAALHTSGRAGQVATYLATENELSFELFGYRGIELRIDTCM